MRNSAEAEQGRKRKRVDGDKRRSCNACNRCKSKKLRCHYATDDPKSHQKCTPCDKSGAECEYEILSDSVPRSSIYVSELETKVTALEEALRQASLPQIRSHVSTTDSPSSQPPHLAGIASLHPLQSPITQSSHPGHFPLANPSQPAHVAISPPSVRPTIFNLIHHDHCTERLCEEPSEAVGRQLIEATYQYTQARYCIVDWVQVRSWHDHR